MRRTFLWLFLQERESLEADLLSLQAENNEMEEKIKDLEEYQVYFLFTSLLLLHFYSQKNGTTRNYEITM